MRTALTTRPENLPLDQSNTDVDWVVPDGHPLRWTDAAFFSNGRAARTNHEQSEPYSAGAGSATRKHLRDLELGMAISASQRQYLESHWYEFRSDWPSLPALRSVREHTREVIERLRRSENVATGDTSRSDGSPTTPFTPNEAEGDS